MSPGPGANRIGELVGAKYRIVRLLARGGMGVVYEAHHAVVRRRFAVKLLRPELAQRRDILTRFQREAEAAGALESENIAAAVDFGVADDGTPYLVMEYLVGESLAALIDREGKLAVTRAADLVAQACRGIHAAHASGIVHRDLKPQNLFICRREDGTDLLKVLDFGVAKLQAIDELSATKTGAIVGTVSYMSPEQARGDRVIDQRADVYALGAILYELVSLQRPHPGDSPNAMLHHISTHPAVPLDTVQAGLPPALVDVVGRALCSDPAGRPASADELAQTLAPFARREVWPAPPTEDSGARAGALSSTLLAPGAAARSGATASTADERALVQPRPRRRSLTRLLIGGGLAVAVATLAVGGARRAINGRAGADRTHTLRPAILATDTRFLNSEPPPGAAQHIESLVKANAVRDATLLNAMVATPSAFWFAGGSPEQVETDVRGTVARGARQGRVPVVVAYNHPFKDCTGYGVTGAASASEFQAWIDGFARGIGNEKAIVILEPNSLGLIPYGAQFGGEQDSCRPTVASPEGKRVPPAEATPAERYRQLAYALDSLQRRAPNAAVYLDGTHSNWLPVGDAAYRLKQAGVERATGFYLNVGNYQPTRRLIQYGTWIAKCLHHAAAISGAADPIKPYRDCASPPAWSDTGDDREWSKVDAWYAEHVDHGNHPPPSGALAHFVINTNRNGRGPLIAARYAAPPFNQPPAVVEAIRNGSWCMPPERGVGLRPTVDTRVPLVDAFLWTDAPGISVASCDIAGGARAWDYSKYNPWGIAGDAQNHFDPLWGMVAPPTGTWFPEEALQLARNAEPPLLPAADASESSGRAGAALAGGAEAAESAGRRSPASLPSRAAAVGKRAGAAGGRPRERPDVRPAATATSGDAEPVAVPPSRTGRNAAAAAFDPDNPYR